MSLQTLGVLALCATLASLALFVFFHNRRAAENRRFALASLAIAGWIVCISFSLTAQTADTIVTLGRLGFAFASVIPFSLLWMFDAFSADSGHRLKFKILLPAVFCGVFVLLSLSPWIVAGARIQPERASFVYGPAHRAFGAYFLLSFVFSLFSLWRTIRSTAGTRKLQLRYLLLGILLGGAGAISTNLIIPLLWKTSTYSFLGPYFSLLVVSFSAHAIIRYRLMDVRIVIRQGVVYVSAIIASASVFLGLAHIYRQTSGFDTNRISLAEALTLAIIVAIAFQPLKSWIQRSLNRYVYRETYDFQRTIRQASREISSTLDLDSLLQYLTVTLERTFKSEQVTVYLQGLGQRSYVPRERPGQPSWARTALPPSISEQAALVTFMRQERRPLVHDEAIRNPAHQLLTAAARELRVLGGDVAFPLLDDQTLAGMLVVGPKRSGDPYFAEDIDLFSTLVNQAAVAMKNAHLYREVVLVNEYVDNILSTMASGVIAVDASGHLSLSNPAAERLTGMRLRRRPTFSYNELPLALAGPLRETLAEGKAYTQLETSLQTLDGTLLPLVYSTASLQDKNGTTHGALIVFSDLSRLKELEREKHRAERLASFGSLASGVAHEIKNPLVAIRTFAELLPERFADVDFRDDFSKVVVREIDRIDNLVARLRGIASAPQHQTGSVDLRHPISDTLKLLRGQLEQTRTTVKHMIEDDAPFVTIEDAQLKQLFLNIFQNALEAMGHGGELSIRIARTTAPGPAWIRVEVSDTGPGMPESVRTHAFDPFFTTKPTGSGLGLAICRSIVDAHRGTIRAENNAATSGTTIIVELPAADAAAETLQGAVRG
ncbi:MAG TPA: ATP-binding protein [Methylomirabilota bacterium]|nr:ATP-binding protein [Methylomirabilota bacterium]